MEAHKEAMAMTNIVPSKRDYLNRWVQFGEDEFIEEVGRNRFIVKCLMDYHPIVFKSRKAASLALNAYVKELEVA